ncbi:MAG: polyprenyl synthetase family protein [Acidobacteriota bacterium]
MSHQTKPLPQPDSDTNEYLQQQRQVVDDYLEEFLPRADSYPEVLHEAMRYSVFAGGKRIRPVLALATGEALEGEFQRLIYFACSLELIHTYSLVHDDLPAMDDDDFRRGRAATHKQFGEGVAILAGNALLTHGFQLLGSIPGPPELAEIKLALINRMCRSIGSSRGMLGGQVVDLVTQGQPFSRDQLEYIHSSKTGALIQASVCGAAVLSNASEECSQRLNVFGSSIGLAFQIVDDILDVVGSSQEMGKSSGKDSERRKATYPEMYGMENSRKIAYELVDNAIQEIGFLGERGERLKEIAQFISVRRF